MFKKKGLTIERHCIAKFDLNLAVRKVKKAIIACCWNNPPQSYDVTWITIGFVQIIKALITVAPGDEKSNSLYLKYMTIQCHVDRVFQIKPHFVFTPMEKKWVGF